MTVSRRLALLAVATAIAGLLAQSSAAARPGLPFTLGTTHFLVHYQSDTTTTYATTQTQAGDIAQLAENAYTNETGDGYAPPLADSGLGGDDRIDIYVEDLGTTGVLGETIPDNAAAAQTSGYIELNGHTGATGFDQHTIAHELFHLFQLAIWQPQNLSDYWLMEATAEWMGFRADGYGAGTGVTFGPSDLSLDCRDPNGTSKCDATSAYKNNGYVKWPFFEWAAEKYGASFVKDVFAAGAAGAPTATQALANTLAAKGTSLAAAFDAWTQVDMQGAYTPKILQGTSPTPFTTVETGDKAGTVASTTVTVNHLATRYIEFDRGTADPGAQCHPATLALTVTFPTQTSSLPLFWWKTSDGSGNSFVPLTPSGGTATATVPWDTCTWSSAAGFLALPNASPSLDAAPFTVTAVMTVDGATPASATAPPAPASVNTPVVPVTTTEDAPQISAFGPELLRVAAGESSVRLIVESDAEGSLVATLGSATLGTVLLRPGANDVRFVLPKSMLTALRRQAATSQLVLTPLSPQGHVQGAPVLRSVAIAPAKPTKKKTTRRK